MENNIKEIIPEIIGLIIIVGSLCFMGYFQYKSKHISESEKQEQKIYKEEYYKKFHTTDGQVCCPKCRSAQISILARRWTFLSGFLTGKIDRVCLNCKHKF